MIHNLETVPETPGVPGWWSESVGPKCLPGGVDSDRRGVDGGRDSVLGPCLGLLGWGGGGEMGLGKGQVPVEQPRASWR